MNSEICYTVGGNQVIDPESPIALAALAAIGREVRRPGTPRTPRRGLLWGVALLVLGWGLGLGLELGGPRLEGGI
jgi:hypothetical protein